MHSVHCASVDRVSQSVGVCVGRQTECGDLVQDPVATVAIVAGNMTESCFSSILPVRRLLQTDGITDLVKTDVLLCRFQIWGVFLATYLQVCHFVWGL